MYMNEQLSRHAVLLPVGMLTRLVHMCYSKIIVQFIDVFAHPVVRTITMYACQDTHSIN